MCDYNEVFSKIARYRSIKAQAEKEIEALEKVIKEYMTESEMGELIGDEHKAIYREVESKRVDTTAFKREMPELAERFTKVSKTMRFTFN